MVCKLKSSRNEKNNFKIDENNAPKEEVEFFEESCEVNEIYSMHDPHCSLASK